MAEATTAPVLSDRTREALGVTFLLTSVYFLICLLTWHADDLGFRVYPAAEEVLNKGGKVGAQLASFMYRNFGLGSFFLAGLIAFWGVRFFFRMDSRGPVLKTVAVIGTLMTASIFFSLQGVLTPTSVGLESIISTSGGMYGEIGAYFLYETLGIGSYLLIIAALLICMLIATDWTLLGGLKIVAPRVGNLLVGWTRRRSAPVDDRGGFTPEPDDEDDKDAKKAAKKAEKHRLKQEREREKEARRREREEAKARAAAEKEAAAEAKAAEAEAEAEAAKEREENRPPVDKAAIRAAVLGNRRSTAAPAKSPRKPTSQDMTNPDLIPPVDILEEHTASIHAVSEKDIEARKKLIEDRLKDFKVEVKVVDHMVGPVLTTYILELAPGLKISKLASYNEDLALSLKSPSVRIVAPIPGTSYVGVEVPNPYTETVGLREMLENAAVDTAKDPLPLYLGKDAAGSPIVASLAKMPNLLIAGTVGSGKSVCLNTILLSMLYSHTPDELKMILVDPKMVELSAFKSLPHLMAPVITDMQKASRILDWLVNEMEDRYELFSRVGAKKIDTFNKLGKEKIVERLELSGVPCDENTPTKLPYIVVIIDELSDMMMVASKEVETAIIRLTQKSRAAGIHLVIATQRPSVDVITGLIKSNLPARIAFKVSAKVDSRTILDANGAEQLLGRGDMLVQLPGNFELIRGQCTFVDDQENFDVVKYLKARGKPEFHDELMSIESGVDLELDGPADDMFDQAVQIILESQRGSASLLQRRLTIGYSRASRLIEMMEGMGLVGSYQGSKAREVYMTWEEYQEMKEGAESAEQNAKDEYLNRE
jgi:S-DNA-T family DNA segregation ATPase FtsK/SpoIIIE